MKECESHIVNNNNDNDMVIMMIIIIKNAFPYSVLVCTVARVFTHYLI